MKKIQFIAQKKRMDCGIACLQMLLKVYNKKINLSEELKKSADTDGISIQQMVDCLKSHQIETVIGRLPVQTIYEITTPLIVLIENHYIILQRIKNTFVIHDPARGIVKLSHLEFLKQYVKNNSEIVVIQPTTSPPRMNWSLRWNKTTTLFTMLPKRKIILSIAILILLSSMLFLQSNLQGDLVEEGLLKKNGKVLYQLLIYLVAITILELFIHYWNNNRGLGIQKTVQENGIIKYFSSIRKNIKNFSNNGIIGNRLQIIEDYHNVSHFVATEIPQIIYSTMLIIFITSYLSTINSWIGSIFIGFSILGIIWVRLFRKQQVGLEQQRYDAESYQQQISIDFITAIEAVRLQQNFNYLNTKLKEGIQQNYTIRFKRLGIQFLQRFGYTTILQVKLTIIYLWLGNNYFKGQIQLGDFIATSFLLTYSIAPLENIVEFIQRYIETKKAHQRITDENEEISEPKSTQSNVTLYKPLLFSSISYTYPNTGTAIFQDATVVIPPHKTTLLIGKSGSGKSTLIQLMLGILELESGSIILGSQEVNENNKLIWHEKVGIIRQNLQIISGNIKENILLGQRYDEKKFTRIIEICHLKELIEQFPQKTETKIGQDGVQLSNGQYQRLQLARVLYSEPELLIIDEGTNAIDIRTEHLILKAIRENYPLITMLIVSHREQTEQFGDQILTISKGKVYYKNYKKSENRRRKRKPRSNQIEKDTIQSILLTDKG